MATSRLARLNVQAGISWLTSPAPIAGLVTFRVLFGALMLGSTIRFWAMGWIEEHFVEPRVHFHYFGFDWVEPLPAWGMYAVHAAMILASLGVAVGFRYRISAFVLALCFTYCELIDLTWYLNHYYFVSLVSWLMVLLPAHGALSVDAARNPAIARSEVPRYVMLLLQVQLSLVYFFAGWAKINHDWLLEALPLRIWLPAHDDLPLIGWTFRYPLTAYLFSWAGMLYDAFIPLLLWVRFTRPWAFAAVVVFHLLTGLLFQIGVFPVVMICLTTLFFSAEWHQRLQRLFVGRMVQVAEVKWVSPPRWPLALAGIYLCFQLLFPWRYLLYDGNLFWNEEGYRFSWRVMLVEKAGDATFYVKDPATGREGVVDNREFLLPHQEKQMSFQPDMILQFAHFLADHYQQPGQPRPEVRAEVYVTMNGRPSQFYIDPTVNLAALRDGWAQKTWVLPFPSTSSP